MNIKLKVEGLDKLKAALDKFPEEIQRNLQAASDEVNKEIIETEGLKKYPPETAANQPPVPYYKRGSGTQTAHGNLGNSEKLGTRWYVVSKSSGWRTEIGNTASYAPKVHGENQQANFARIGWRKLYDVATEKIPKITKIYQAWVNRAIKKLGL